MTPRHPTLHSGGSRRAFLGGMLAAGGAAAWPGAAGTQAFDFKPNQRYPDPAVQVLDPSFAKYRLFNSTVEQVATGLRWAEGPVWFGDGRYLLVSDIPNNRIVRWDEATGQLGVFRQPSNFSNGLARDRQGRLLACEHLTRRITRTEYDGSITVLADGYGGKRFNSPNDIVCGSDGSIWFTDPSFGISGHWEGDKATPELPHSVYRIDPQSGRTELVLDDLAGPNGLCFSADEQRLYIVESRAQPHRVVWAFDVAAGGRRLANRRVHIKAAGGGALDGISTCPSAARTSRSAAPSAIAFSWPPAIRSTRFTSRHAARPEASRGPESFHNKETTTMQRRTFTLHALALGAGAMLGAGPALAQAPWPTGKTITYLVPFAAGGTTDTLGRLISQQLGTALGTTVVVDNKGGAGGSVGSEIAARAAPDGYTLLGGTISSHAINVSLYPKLGYDPVKSFAPVTLIGTNPVVLVVAAGSPYKTLQDVLAAAKAKPGGLSSASAGTGTSQHLALELLAYKSGVKFTHVPYKGSGPAIQDVIGGQVDMMFDTTVVAAPHIQSGKLRAIAVTSAKRLASMPDVPTVAESGVASLKDFEVVSWQAIFVPAGTPAPIVNRLHDEIRKILAQPDMQAKLKGFGMEPADLTIAQIATFQKAEVEKWAQVIKAANVKVD